MSENNEGEIINREMAKIALLCLAILGFYGDCSFALEDPLWGKYKENFLSHDGRIIDHSQQGISHSEGQGYGLLLAIAHNDKPTFDLIWHWTKSNLRQRADGLFAWQWGKRSNKNWEVVDMNNATDGDILIAYALLKAYQKWPKEEYRNEALATVRSIRTKLAINWDGHSYLLPGYYGFTRENAILLNPSYLIFPAFRIFAQFDQKDFWEKIYNDGLFVLSKCHFGDEGLPTDWISVSEKGVFSYDERNPNYGYDAIRLMYYVSLENIGSFPGGKEWIFDIYEKLRYIPQFVDIRSESISLKAAPGGFYAIYSYIARKMGKEVLSARLAREASEKLKSEKNNYYSYSLYLLAINDGRF